MTPAQKAEPMDKCQLDKFKDAARELECDDDEQRFKERLGKIAKAPIPPPSKGSD